MNPVDVYAQTDAIGPTVWRIIYSLVGLVVVLLLFLIYRNFRGRMGSSSENLRNTGGLDLVSLKKKGLLTPEELEKVGQSMLRQMKQQEELKRRKMGAKSADALLLDPEVQRLQALAAAREESEKAQQVQQVPTAAPESVTPTVSNPIVPDQRAEPAADTAVAGSGTEDLSSVELPLDIQQLVDSGLLSPEEVQNVKRRILERRRQGL